MTLGLGTGLDRSATAAVGTPPEAPELTADSDTVTADSITHTADEE